MEASGDLLELESRARRCRCGLAVVLPSELVLLEEFDRSSSCRENHERCDAASPTPVDVDARSGRACPPRTAASARVSPTAARARWDAQQ
mmetsp:Transcript_15785/g.42443  ORF Transcript_15785/g.42443 Transcript_15785/m.42443 type:complete len:90 (-) Transcript_15785:215-484(-)